MLRKNTRQKVAGSLALHLKSFDDAVRSDSRHFQILAELFGGLVVHVSFLLVFGSYNLVGIGNQFF